MHHRSDLALHGSLPVNSERKNIALSVLVGWVARCVVLLPYSSCFYFYTLFLLIRGLSPRVPRTQIALTKWPAPGDCYRKVKATRVRSLPMPALGTTKKWTAVSWVPHEHPDGRWRATNTLYSNVASMLPGLLPHGVPSDAYFGYKYKCCFIDKH